MMTIFTSLIIFTYKLKTNYVLGVTYQNVGFAQNYYSCQAIENNCHTWRNQPVLHVNLIITDFYSIWCH